MSCGQIALNRAGIKYDKYFASEIDRWAIEVTQKNYPDTVQLGDVTKWKEWDLPKIDLLFGGSPCQGFSFAGKQLNFQDPRSKLFFVFVDILKYFRPKYFLFENVRMKKEYQNVISELLEVEPIEINSNLLSAQNRKRLYWTNIPNVKIPESNDIMLHNIIDNQCDIQERMSESKRLGNHYGTINTEKSPTLMAIGKCDVLYLTDKKRYLTPIECERLQTVPDNYTNHVSDSHRYKMLGNGWTVDVIAHIFKNIKNE